LLMKVHQLEPTTGRDVEAFNLAERWRARSLAEMIYESRDDLRKELPEDLQRREEVLSASVTKIQRDLFRPGLSAAREQELKRRLTKVERDFDLLRVELRNAGSRYAVGRYAETLDATAIRQHLLDADTALIEYALGADQSHAWVLTRAGVRSISLARRADVEARVSAYRKLLAERVTALSVNSALARLDAESRNLHRLLIAPIEAALAGKKRLIIVPDGVLAYLPFETLQGATRLLERFSISYAPSASTLAAIRQRGLRKAPPTRNLLAFADPIVASASTVAQAWERERAMALTPLPNTRTEVSAIRSLFNAASTQVHLGADAQEQSLKSEQLESFRYLHFAAHGYFDEEEPARSGIVLSQAGDSSSDGLLQAPEIMRLRLNADLVTLSACQSGLGRVLAGEGVLGLTRAFLYAGAQSVVVSLWNVNDVATAELMKHLYTNLRAGQPRDQALRQAKLTLMKTPNSPWKHPYFWAPFIFIGDPSR
jgi:CHAT domain-containing protein